MFDLIEEDLLTKSALPVPPQPPPSNPLSEPVVISMPEKFRKKKKKSLGLPLAIAGGTLVVLGSIGGVMYMLFAQPQQQQPIPDVIQQSHSELSNASTSPILVPNLDSNESSTASVLEETTSTLISGTENLTSESTTSSLTADASPLVTSTQNQPQEQAPDLVKNENTPGTDSDTDILTDTEERLYGTDPEKPDTDEDGFLDGTELSGGFDPTKGAGAKIANSSLVNTYTNTDFGYSFVYPSSWVASGANQQNREVLVSTATGEFFSFTVQDNPDKLSPLAWATAGPNADPAAGPFTAQASDDIETATSKDEHIVIIALHSSTRADPSILVVRYNLNTKNEINFLATFKMMAKSVSILPAQE